MIPVVIPVVIPIPGFECFERDREAVFDGVADQVPIDRLHGIERALEGIRDDGVHLVPVDGLERQGDALADLLAEVLEVDMDALERFVEIVVVMVRPGASLGSLAQSGGQGAGLAFPVDLELDGFSGAAP